MEPLQPQLQDLVDKLAPVVEEARATLLTVSPDKIALRSGCQRDAEGRFRLTFLGQEYLISPDDFTVRRADSGAETPTFLSSIILTYLATADGTTPSGRLVGFRDLPDGMFYAVAFQGYTGLRLVRELRGGIAALRRAAESLGGRPLDLGDAGYSFQVLPHVLLALVYWEGDDEFPSQARVLFEDSAAHYMPIYGLALLGSQLVSRVLKAARQ